MALIDRLIGTAEPRIPAHQFMAALGEFQRGAPGVTLAAIASTFAITVAQEVTDLGTVANLLITNQITQNLLHDVLLLGEVGVYDANACIARILTPSTPDVGSILLQHGIDALRIGVNDFSLSGCAVTAQGSPNMTLAVTKGAVMSGGVLVAVTAGNVTIGAADANLPRLDLVCISSNGTKTVRQGTASTSPKVTTYQAGDVPLAIVFVAPGATSIDSTKLSNAQVNELRGPVTVGKITTAVVKNTSLAQQTFVSLVLPSGLFLAGKTLRVRCGGTMLFNSGVPTATLAISYGGTVMFQDVTGAATASATRLAWDLDFILVAHTNTSQALNGNLALGPIATKTAPTTGVGDIAVVGSLANSPVIAPINGSAAIDSDAGDRTLAIMWTMSVSNVADEIVMEHGTAELV